MDIEDSWDDPDDEILVCPECSADVHVDAEQCPDCGYWITDEDRSAAWRQNSASGQLITIGFWVIVATLAAVLWLFLTGP